MILTVDEIRALLIRKGDLHTATAARIFKVPEEQVTPEQRHFAKLINFRCLYDPDFWRQVMGVQL